MVSCLWWNELLENAIVPPKCHVSHKLNWVFKPEKFSYLSCSFFKEQRLLIIPTSIYSLLPTSHFYFNFNFETVFGQLEKSRFLDLAGGKENDESLA